jgi:hypothetical protein
MKIILDKVIESQMKQRKVSLSEISKKTKIPRSTLLDWSHGRKPSSKNIHLLLNLSKFFEITLNQLLFGIISDTRTEILFTSTFKDNHSTYRLTVERIEHLGDKND